MIAKVYTHRGTNACMLKGMPSMTPSQEQNVQMIAQFLLMNARISPPNCDERFNSKQSWHIKCAAGLGHSKRTCRWKSSLQMQHWEVGGDSTERGGGGEGGGTGKRESEPVHGSRAIADIEVRDHCVALSLAAAAVAPQAAHLQYT